MKFLFENQNYEINEDVLKLSDYLKWLYDGAESNEEPILISGTNQKQIDLFIKWFNKLEKFKIVNCSAIDLKDNVKIIFDEELFEDLKFEDLVDMLDFAFKNQITILINTITKILSNNYELKHSNDSYYFIYNREIFDNDEEFYTIRWKKFILPQIYVKIMTEEYNYVNYNEVINIINEPNDLKNTTLKEIRTDRYGNKFYNGGVVVIPNTIEPEEFYGSSIIKAYMTETSKHSLNSIIPLKAFSDCKMLKEIVMSDNITTLQEAAFDDCFALTKVILPHNLVSIEDKCFRDCVKLKSLNLPNSLTRIGEDAFIFCSNLQHITFSKNLKYIGDYAFDNCALVDINLPNSLKDINRGSFACCSFLKTVKLPESIKRICCSAFKHCSTLENINLPKSLKAIGPSAFYKCDKLKDIDKEKIKLINPNAFVEY